MGIVVSFSPLTIVFIVSISVLTLYFHARPLSEKVLDIAPSVLTSFGIFGTFLGVAIGLHEFDSTNVEASVPLLMSGLKTAFWSSIAGLFGALSIKLRYGAVILGEASTKNSVHKASIDDLAELLVNIRDGDGRAHQQLLRQSISVEKSMGDFLDRMVEVNTNALVSAIEHVIREFNLRIDEQYGDNFKRLNDAVGTMMMWQEQHQKDLQTLWKKQAEATHNFSTAGDKFGKVVKEAESFSKAADSLGNMLSGFDEQRHVMDTFLREFSMVVSKTVESLPDLKTRVDYLTDKLSEAVEANQERVSEQVRMANDAFQETIASSCLELQGSITNVNHSMHETMQAAVSSVDKQIIKLDEALEEELTKSLQSFGFQMTALSEKFVSDYLPLTERLQDLVQLSESVVCDSDKQSGARSGKGENAA